MGKGTTSSRVITALPARSLSLKDIFSDQPHLLTRLNEGARAFLEELCRAPKYASWLYLRSNAIRNLSARDLSALSAQAHEDHELLNNLSTDARRFRWRCKSAAESVTQAQFNVDRVALETSHLTTSGMLAPVHVQLQLSTQSGTFSDLHKALSSDLHVLESLQEAYDALVQIVRVVDDALMDEIRLREARQTYASRKRELASSPTKNSFEHLLHGLIGVPDNIPLTSLPLRTSSGALVDLLSYDLSPVPKGRNVRRHVTTVGQLQAAYAEGYGFYCSRGGASTSFYSRTQVSVIYPKAQRVIALRVLQLDLTELAQAVVAFTKNASVA